MSAHPRLPAGSVVYWSRPAPDQRWDSEGVGRVHADHGRTVTLDDGTLLLRGEALRLRAWWKEVGK